MSESRLDQIVYFIDANGNPVAVSPTNPFPMTGGGGGSSSVSAADITDASTVGKQVLTAANAAAVRTAIGAGTSNLAVGTGAAEAKAGNYQPTAANISDASTVGRQVLTATDAAAARTAIGAGTSNLAIGTTAGTAMAGNTIIPAAAPTGTAALLLAGTDTTPRLFSAKDIHDEIARQIAAIPG
ncbi:hypothetical protein [Paenibacillus sp. FSL L8-0463]|uniref:hypothetical protein n=1 Tax=Paenibacillus sp. FSL L8-0463 TaxID=2954687 RepID=UPI003119817C